MLSHSLVSIPQVKGPAFIGKLGNAHFAIERQQALCTVKTIALPTNVLDSCPDLVIISVLLALISYNQDNQLMTAPATKAYPIFKMVQQAKISVQFKLIEIFEYPITLGGNPSATSGAPTLTIKWERQRKSTFPLEYFESHRPAFKQKDKLRISQQGREHLLHRCGFSDEEIITAALEATGWQ